MTAAVGGRGVATDKFLKKAVWRPPNSLFQLKPQENSNLLPRRFWKIVFCFFLAFFSPTRARPPLREYSPNGLPGHPGPFWSPRRSKVGDIYNPPNPCYKNAKQSCFKKALVFPVLQAVVVVCFRGVVLMVGAAGSAHAGKSGRAPSQEGPLGRTKMLLLIKRSCGRYKRSLFRGPESRNPHIDSRCWKTIHSDRKSSGAAGLKGDERRIGVVTASGRRQRRNV